MTSLSFLGVFFTVLPFPLKFLMLLIGLPVLFLGPVHEQEIVAVEAPHVQRAKQAKPMHRPLKPGLPGENKEAVVKPIKLMVNLDGSYQLMGVEITEAELSKRLKTMAAGTPGMCIEISAEKNTPHQMVAKAMELCKAAGVTRLQFSSRPASP